MKLVTGSKKERQRGREAPCNGPYLGFGNRDCGETQRLAVKDICLVQGARGDQQVDVSQTGDHSDAAFNCAFVFNIEVDSCLRTQHKSWLLSLSYGAVNPRIPARVGDWYVRRNPYPVHVYSVLCSPYPYPASPLYHSTTMSCIPLPWVNVLEPPPSLAIFTTPE